MVVHDLSFQIYQSAKVNSTFMSACFDWFISVLSLSPSAKCFVYPTAFIECFSRVWDYYVTFHRMLRSELC